MSSLPSLMERLAIKAVYWVDDENATPQEMSVEKLAKAVAEELGRSEAKVRKPALGKLRTIQKARKLADDIETLLAKDDIEDAVGAIENLFGSQLDKVVDEPITTLNEMLSVLPHPLNPQERQGLVDAFQERKTWEWTEMSFARWGTEHTNILDRHTQEGGNALLIVDLQNSRESSPLSGRDVLAQWAARVSQLQGPVPVFAVALTFQCKQDKELLEGRRLTNALFEGNPTPSLPVLVISKNRLSSDVPESPTGPLVTKAFESSLSRLRACALHSSLAKELEKLFATSVESAFAKLQQLSIEEMLYAVSSTSYFEGASEIDTLVRMASIAQRQALLSGVAESDKITRELIELRGLHDHIGFVKREELDSTDGIEKLRCSELHDPAEVVNRLLSPVASGDIFEISRDGSTEYQILVSNACDLMLRGQTGERNLDVGLLLFLGEVGDQKCGSESMMFPISDFPHGSPLTGKTCAVNLRRMLTVPLDVLDLSWTNSQGNCSWIRGQAPSDDLNLLPSQRRRYDRICHCLEAIGDKEQLQWLAPSVPFECQFSGQPASIDKVTFAVRRTGRLSMRVGAELIQKFAQTLARPSLEHDFSMSSRA